MVTERLMALVKSMAQQAQDQQQIDDLIRLVQLLAMLKNDRLAELEKELAERKLRDRYKDRIKKAAG